MAKTYIKTKKILVVVALLLVAGGVGYTLYAAKKREQTGRDKFSAAIAELGMDKQYDNPCLGTSVLRNYSYAELSKKSVEEIKEMAKIDPGSC